jgi:hypothetical protein
MKKIFWTTVFWLVVFFGFAFYMKMFDAQMAAGVTTRLGVTTITTSGEAIVSGAVQTDVMSGINAIQTTLTDMQTTLDKLAGETTPTVTPTPVVEEKPTTPAVTPTTAE